MTAERLAELRKQLDDLDPAKLEAECDRLVDAYLASAVQKLKESIIKPLCEEAGMDFDLQRLKFKPGQVYQAKYGCEEYSYPADYTSDELEGRRQVASDLELLALVKPEVEEQALIGDLAYDIEDWLGTGISPESVALHYCFPCEKKS